MKLKLFLMILAILSLSACGGGDGGSTLGALGVDDGAGVVDTLTDQSQAEEFEIAVIGDMPYRELSGGWTNLVNEVNSADVAFVVHTGDFKSGKRPCTNEYYPEMFTQFQLFQHPLFYVPGEADWATCTRDDNGRYYPEERLDLLRTTFYSTNQSLGRNAWTLTRQSNAMVGFEGFPENSFWQHRGITFATVHVTGINDNTQVQQNDVLLAQNLQRGVEQRRRMEANLAWLNHVFAEAKRANSAGLMLFTHASFPDWDYNLADGISANSSNNSLVFKPFFDRLTELARTYNKPVMLVHGDSHYYRFDKPMIDPDYKNIPYFSRLETFGDKDMHWVRVKVKISPNSKDIFFAQPEMVAGNARSIPDSAAVRDCGFCTSGSKFDVALIGDTPYDEPMAAWSNLVADIQRNDVAFTVHVGNFKPEWSSCDDAYYNKMVGEFNNFTKPLFYTPGDNEWLDCPPSSPYTTAEERLARIRQVFTAHGDISFGQPPHIFLQSQSELLGYRQFSENRMWEKDNVLFATFHVVGTNNNQGGAEFAERNNANQRWLEMVFQEAKRKDVAGIMLFTHADLNWQYNTVPNPVPRNGYTDIVNKLRSETIVFGKPVALVHGNRRPDAVAKAYGKGFDFIIDKPLRDENNEYMLENFTRVHVFGDKNVHWVRAHIDPNHPDLFLFEPEIVEPNLDAYLNP